MSDGYDNTSYWKKIHVAHGENLRAVGHPELSEEINRLKYLSEYSSLRAVLEACSGKLSGDKKVTFLDIGAGNGFWTTRVSAWLKEKDKEAETTALDISTEALGFIKQKSPDVNTVQEDLKVVDPGKYHHGFDLVTSVYCLHHLARIDDFLNALRFAARSVKQNGMLLVMDPVLTNAYSPFHKIDYNSFTGNGMPRQLLLLDDLLHREGLRRVEKRSAVSFVLNGSIEGGSAFSYGLTRVLWSVIHAVCKNEVLTKMLSPTLKWLDWFFKKTGASNSSSVLVYHKSEQSR